MNPIIPSGVFFEHDAEGCIINPTSRAHVAQDLWPLVDAVVGFYAQYFGADLRAVYLRGSVPRGMAMPPTSDLDVVGIVQFHHTHDAFVRWATPAWASDAQTQIQARFPNAPSIDFAMAHHDPAFPGQNRAVKFVLQTQALCIWGMEDTLAWPACKPDRSIAFNHRWLASDWQQWQAQWQRQPNSPDKEAFLQSFAKTVLRAGFELVMEREGRYTVDLYPCWQTFSRHYPDHAPAMEAALLSYLNPNLPDAAHTSWMADLLPYLIAESAIRLTQ